MCIRDSCSAAAQDGTQREGWKLPGATFVFPSAVAVMASSASFFSLAPSATPASTFTVSTVRRASATS
eukprot:599797-Alexandrium_andersonii.AAC.1